MTNKLYLIGLGLAGIYVGSRTGELDPDPMFEKPAAEVVAALDGKSRMVLGTGLGALTVTGRRGGENTAAIAVRRAGAARALACQVMVDPVAERRSRAGIDCDQRGTADAGTRRLALKALNIVVREHVVATVEERPYDIHTVADRMIGFTEFNAPALAEATMVPKKRGVPESVAKIND